MRFSQTPNNRPSAKKSWKVFWLYAITGFISPFFYTLSEINSNGGIGFPLDDAWIHQVFARNLAHGYGFSFNPGIPIAGSTSILWSFLLAASEFLPGSAVFWAKVWGVLFLILSAFLIYQIARLVLDERDAIVVGELTLVSPHLVWSSLSGMEATLFPALCLVALYFFLNRSGTIKYLVSSIFFGFATLARPEGILVFGIVLIGDLATRFWLRTITPRECVTVLLSLFLYGLILTPFGLFNLQTAHVITPNTFPAVVGEKGLIMALSRGDWGEILQSVFIYPARAIPQFILYLAIDNLFLLLFFLIGIGMIVKKMFAKPVADNANHILLVVLAVMLGMTFFRAMVFPVRDLNYHMGRYLTLDTPFYVLIAFVGLKYAVPSITAFLKNIRVRIVTIFGALAVGVSSVLVIWGDQFFLPVIRWYYALGAHAIAFDERWFMIQIYYRLFGIACLILGLIVIASATYRWRSVWVNNLIGSKNMWLVGAYLFGVIATLSMANVYLGMVKNVNDINVSMGQWIAQNTPPGSRIATNDIGALGYFSERQIVDVIGLITPEIISYLPAGEEGIIQFLQKERPDYIAIFPNWYPKLARLPGFMPIHSTTTKPNLISGGSQLILYQIKWNEASTDKGVFESK